LEALFVEAQVRAQSEIVKLIRQGLDLHSNIRGVYYIMIIDLVNADGAIKKLKRNNYNY